MTETEDFAFEFDPQSIEHKFAIILGKVIGLRGEPYDSDYFQVGDREELGKALRNVCECLRNRFDQVKFISVENQPAGAKLRIYTAIDSLERLALNMINSKGREPEDYHWMIIADLLLVIGSTLDHFEGKGEPQPHIYHQ